MASTNPEIERAFASITKSIFGQSLAGHEAYGPWLLAHVRPPVAQKSAVSDEVMVVPSYSYYTEPGKRAVTLAESQTEGLKMLSEADIGRLTLSNAASILSPIKLYSPDVRFGTTFAMEECGVYFWSSNCYASTWVGHGKYCAYCMWPRNSEYCFGCEFSFSCKSCLKCHHSVDLTRCFEVSYSNSCSDCLYCHNCENVQHGLFCFNAKSLRYAVFNVEVGPERYAQVKKRIIGSILSRLEKDKRLDWNVFNVGAQKKA